MDQQEQVFKKQRKIAVLVLVVIVPVVTVSGFFLYLKLSGSYEQTVQGQETQEQFAGEVVVSEQLQSECQKSAEKIVKAADVNNAVAEYKQNVANCKDINFVIDGKNKFKNEGVYPDLVVDLAIQQSKTDKPKALELLAFAKALPPWDFNMGPTSCQSGVVLDAYQESIALSEEKACIKMSEYKEKLLPELKSKRFSSLTKLVPNESVVWVGLPESDVGCPQKISGVLKLLQATSSGAELDESKPDIASAKNINFTYKSKTEDKLILEFAENKECLEFTSVLVPGTPTNE